MLKGTTEKVINQKLGFFGPLMKVALTLIKNELKPLAKNVLMSLGLTVAAQTTDAAIQKKKSWIWDEYNNNLKRANEKYHENS